MQYESCDINEIVETRRRSVKKSLRQINVSELTALTDELFPYVEHPHRQDFLTVINDIQGGTIYHAIVDSRVHVLYCHDKNVGMWYIEGLGKGPLDPNNLGFMREIVEGRQLAP